MNQEIHLHIAIVQLRIALRHVVKVWWIQYILAKVGEFRIWHKKYLFAPNTPFPLAHNCPTIGHDNESYFQQPQINQLHLTKWVLSL